MSVIVRRQPADVARGRAALLRPSEADFTAQVLACARYRQWRTIHVRPARRGVDQEGRQRWETPVQGDGNGWPDIFAVRGDRAVAAELKVRPATSREGRPKPEQTIWLARLAEVPGIECYVWRPGDWDEIEAVLK